MSEERLIEITSEIMKTDGPLGKVAYVSSLSEEEMNFLRSYISNSVYDGLNIYEKLLKFSQDYLESKNISIMNVNASSYEETDNQKSINSYLENMLSNGDKVSMSSGYKSKR